MATAASTPVTPDAVQDLTASSSTTKHEETASLLLKPDAAATRVEEQCVGGHTSMRRGCCRGWHWWHKLQVEFGFNYLGSIMLVYFLQGAKVGFVYLATDYFFKDPKPAGLALSPAAAQALIAVTGIPWNIKPAYGLLSDALPICGTRRKSWLILNGALGTAGYLLVGLIPPSVTGCTVAFFATNLASAFCDVVADAMVAEGAKRESETAAGDLQSLAWGCYALGSMLGALLGGLLYRVVGAQPMLVGFGLLFSLTVPLAFRLDEPRRQGLLLHSLRQQLRLATQACRSPMIWKVVLYIFVTYAAVPSASSATFYFWTDQ
eukprot:SAG11_NODE_4182_length_2024_cov_3.049351_1_plen_319_part_10